jgi:hypothetical protein
LKENCERGHESHDSLGGAKPPWQGCKKLALFLKLALRQKEYKWLIEWFLIVA